MNERRHGLISHRSERRLFMIATPDGWSLPAYGHREARDVNRGIQERFGLCVTVLRYAPEYDAMENHDPGWQPGASGRWVSEDDLDSLSLAGPARRVGCLVRGCRFRCRAAALVPSRLVRRGGRLDQSA